MEMCVFTSQVMVPIYFCSIKLCLHRRGIQPNIAFIFWVTWKGIEDFDKQYYKDDVLLF